MTRISQLIIYLWITPISRLRLFLYLCLCIGFSPGSAYVELSRTEVSSLVSIRDPAVSIDFNNLSSHLSRILIPRPSGSDNNTIVKNYIISRFTALNWDVEEDSFTDMTPYGEKTFTNIIATKNPRAPRRVTLSAHFDSKFFTTYPLNQFVGATDSAAPCAILLDVAETLNDLLDQRQERLSNTPDVDGTEEDDAATTLQMVFFDGEEAFQDWTDTDSLYGSRHLAEKWESEYVSTQTKTKTRRKLIPSQTKLSIIEHLVLLDLLGTRRPRVSSYFLTTGWLFDNLVSVEEKLHAMGVFSSQSRSDGDALDSFFIKRVGNQVNVGVISDDHMPFLVRGVSVLHIIANPFPPVWHKLSDDASALDMPTLKKWSLIFRVFTAEYLHLRPNISNQRDRADLPFST